MPLSIAQLKADALRKGLTGDAINKYVFGTLKKSKESDNMVSIAPAPAAMPSTPSLGSVRRGILTKTPVLAKAPSIFGGSKVPLKGLMQGIRPGGIRKLGATRQHLGSLA